MNNRSIRVKLISDKERQTEKKEDGEFKVESFVVDINTDRSPKRYGATYSHYNIVGMGFGDTRVEAELQAKNDLCSKIG